MDNSIIIYRDYGDIVFDVKSIMDKKRHNCKPSCKENRITS